MRMHMSMHMQMSMHMCAAGTVHAHRASARQLAVGHAGDRITRLHRPHLPRGAVTHLQVASITSAHNLKCRNAYYAHYAQ